MDDGFELDDVDSINRKASEYAKLAIKFDNEENYQAALIYYKEAIDFCFLAANLGSTVPDLKSKTKNYIERAEILKKAIDEQRKLELEKKPKNDEDKKSLKRAQFLLDEALEEDENGEKENAIKLYMESIDLCIKLKGKTNNERIKEQLGKLIDYALNRAESLRGIVRPKKQVNIEQLPIINESLDKLSIDDSQLISNQVVNQSKFNLNEHKLIVIGESNYTKKELFVIKTTSRINTREFVPFLSVDLKERFGCLTEFVDKDGLLALGDKQKKHFCKWLRLNQLVENPKIIKSIDCFSIKQTIVTDCSFIASLIVSAQYEKRFQKKLVTSIIYPQNKNGLPVYNPSGKYMIKFHINGVYRKVIIDDLLPVDSYMGLLCSYSSNEDEFWVSLLEKAYLKVMGGYNFPGSNSSIDLNTITGWIPDRIDIDTDAFDGERTLRNLSEKFNTGNVLITVATGDLSDEQTERCGLVSNHAYALLDIRFVQGKKLLKLKNPWRNQRWRGNYSEIDEKNWNSELIRELNFDPKAAARIDDGCFWIDLYSFTHFFKTIYLNWNPSLFKYTFCTHNFWKLDKGPTFDFYSYDNNPQYKLSIKTQQPTFIWALLTRHITDKDDFANNKVYMAIIVFKDGEKVYVQKEPFIDGVRINSPHYLCKIPIKDDCKDYTLVISQYEKTQTIYYSLRIYSVLPFTLTEIIKNFNFKEEFKDEWNALNSGGCLMNEASYSLNPVYRLEILGNEIENEILIEIKAPKKTSVGFDLYSLQLDNPNSENSFYKKTVDAFRYGVNALAIKKIPKGIYNLIVCTYKPNEKAPYFLKVESTTPFHLKKIK